MQINKNNRMLYFCLLVLSIFSMARLVDNTDYWIVDIFSHFTVQYVFLTLLLLAICLWKKKLPLALLSGLLLACNISALADYGNSVQAAGSRNRTFTVCSSNIDKLNNKLTTVVDKLKETDADILLLLEITDENIMSLQSLIHVYPYHTVNLNITSTGTGVVLMSKFPILNHTFTKYSEFGNMLVSATIKIYNKEIVFFGTHFPKPTDFQEFHIRSKQIMSLAQKIDGQSIPVIMAGDFNTTPYSPTFKKLLKKSGLKDSRDGFGWQPTWPAYLPFFWLPIDHILVSPDIMVHKRSTGPYLGSDHYPVIAELSIKPQIDADTIKYKDITNNN